MLNDSLVASQPIAWETICRDVLNAHIEAFDLDPRRPRDAVTLDALLQSLERNAIISARAAACGRIVEDAIERMQAMPR